MTSHYLNKAVLNKDASVQLVKTPNYHHCSSVHCSYYSCYLQLYHIIFIILSISENDFDSIKNQWLNTNNGGLHQFSIMFVFGKIEDPGTKSKFKNKILELKKLRIDSDYKNISIDKTISDSATNLAEDITKLLTLQFKYTI